MKDFDFDEIDRAVNSLNSSIPLDDDDNDDDDDNKDTKITNQPVDNQSIESASFDNDDTKLTNQSIALAPPSKPLIKKRSTGQFMDVVHPSSDMRKASLAVHGHIPAKGVVADQPVATNPSTEIVQPTPSVNDNTWPDPIDFHESRKNDKEEVEKPNFEPTEDADIDQISDDISSELSNKSDESLDTPFISGTKVEKRPLGAFSAESTVAPAEHINPDENIDKDDSVKVTEPFVVTGTTLSEELQSDLLKIESGDSSTNPTVSRIPEVIEKPVVVPEMPVIENRPITPVAITQQYKEQPSTGDQTSGAIYNTDAYHKALISPSKKKNGWLWVVWIILLIAAGVGAGAAVYYFVLPLL